MKKETKNILSKEIKDILEKPPKDRTAKEWHVWADWRASRMTQKERDIYINKGEEVIKAINQTYKTTGIDKLPQEEQTKAFIDYLKEIEAKERALEAREKELDKKKKELEQKGSYRKPKHLVNATTGVRPIKDKEISLFSGLDETVATFKTPPMLGLDLTRGERKLVNCFSLLLQERSQTINSKELNYFSGDTNKPKLSSYGSDIVAPNPELRTTLYELSKVYHRKDKVSGGEQTVVKNLLKSLMHKTYYVEFNPITYKDKAGEPKSVTWRGRVTLFMLGTTDNKGELFIQLNSIFALQIRDYYVNYPIDFDAQLEEANKKLNDKLNDKKRVTEGVYIFIDYLASNRGAKGIYKHEIYKSNLYDKINFQWLKESRISLLDEPIKRGIEIALMIGLLEKWELVTGATGEKKYIFYTRKDWIK